MFKFFDNLKLIFSSKKENSPTQKTNAKTRHGNAAATHGDNSSIQQAGTINNNYTEMAKTPDEKLIKNVLGEMKYNISSGVGCPTCHFEFTHHSKLLDSNVREDLHEPIRELIKHMKLCNAHGTIRSLEHPPGSVKSQSKILKALLLKEFSFPKND